MRWARTALIAAGTLVVGATLCACPLANESIDPYRCYDDDDCFVAAGEYCAPEGRSYGEPGRCQRRDAGAPDAAVVDQGPAPDRALSDAEADGEPEAGADAAALDGGDHG